MIQNFGKSLLQIRNWGLNHAYFRQYPSLGSIFHFSTDVDHWSFTVGYLRTSCGLSEVTALSTAKKFLLKTPEKADSVIAFLMNQGFSKANIGQIVTLYPRLLVLNVEKGWKPKVQVFQDLGLSTSQLVKLIVSNPAILRYSLKNRIEPSIDNLKGFLGTKNRVISAIQSLPWLIINSCGKSAGINASSLANEGLSQSNISRLIKGHPQLMNCRPDRFNEIILKVKELGFDPCTPSMFLQAICTLSYKDSTLDARSDFYRSLGWSEVEVRVAFRKQPICMRLSEDTIRKKMDFYVKELHFMPSDMASIPNLLLYNLEARIIPRSTVLRILSSKNLLKGGLKPRQTCAALAMPEMKFLKKYVIPHQDEVPGVLEACYDKNNVALSDQTLQHIAR